MEGANGAFAGFEVPTVAGANHPVSGLLRLHAIQLQIRGWQDTGEIQKRGEEIVQILNSRKASRGNGNEKRNRDESDEASES